MHDVVRYLFDGTRVASDTPLDGATPDLMLDLHPPRRRITFR
jgi:hypothetical protein